jgi:hypothetical protein
MAEQTRGVRFDATINLGHILTFVGFLIAGFGAWATLDKRIVVIEEGRKVQTAIDAAQDARFSDSAQQIKEVLIRLDRQVERLNDRLDRTTTKGNP